MPQDIMKTTRHVLSKKGSQNVLDPEDSPFYSKTTSQGPSNDNIEQCKSDYGSSENEQILPC
eukprot:scaffold2642_cov120-Cylindrotheca_fusiformis.AAC.17